MSSSTSVLVRRLLGVLMASVLAVGVLVVASSPAGAANTASESTYNHDNDARTPEIRRFAGANRYATAIGIAEAYVEAASGGDVLIVASGESLVDAAAAAGLAADMQAPVVLTVPDRLSSSVAAFIDANFIAEVFLLGGTSAISSSVEDAIGELETVDSVTRLSGADRYATSAAVAAEMTEVGEYCDTGEVAAIVVNVDGSASDVIAAGPLAYAESLPILLTSSSGLSDEVADFLSDAEIERVIVVGGTASVPATVVADIEAAGVTTVDRISGDSRFATAVAVQAAIADCDGLTVDPNHYALVNADSLADGVAAAPYLGVGPDAVGVVPVMLVTSTGAPSETQDFLSGIAVRTASGTYNDISFTAVGGTAAVTPAALSSAIEAAVTSAPLTASIAARPNTGTARITFSSPVNSATSGALVATSAVTKGFYRISGLPLLGGDGIDIAGNVVTITLSTGDAFVAGDVISIVGARITGVGGDNRRVAATSFTVPATPPDNLRPRVTIFAAEGAHEIRIAIDEPNLANRDALTSFDVTRIQRGRGGSDSSLVADNDDNTGAAVGQATDETVTASGSLVICLFGYDTAATNTSGCETDPIPGQSLLARNELITVTAEAFVDTSGNRSRTTVTRVEANTAASGGNPGVIATRATVTDATVYNPTTDPTMPMPDANAAWIWTDGLTNPATLLSITAKSGGAAGGAPGNDWSVDWAYAPDTASTPGGGLANTAPSASATIYETRKLIRIVVDDDASLFNVAQALLENEDITANFDVASAALANANDPLLDIDLEPIFDSTHVITGAHTGAPGATDNSGTAITFSDDDAFQLVVRRDLEGGQSQVTVSITYNDILEEFGYDALVAANVGTVLTCDPAGRNSLPATAGWTSTSVQARATTFTMVLNSTCLLHLPVVGEEIMLPAGLGTTYADDTDANSMTILATIRLRDS